MVQLYVNIPADKAKSTSAGGWQSLGTLPEVYRPADNICYASFDNSKSTMIDAAMPITINTAGNISWWANGAVSGVRPRGAITYISAS